jgi:dephospho-CoA kinase
MPLFDSAELLIAKIRTLFNRNLALQNDYLRQENKILRSKLGKRVPLNESERRLLVKYGLPIKDRLHEIISIVRPETLLTWHRCMKRKKWTFEHKKIKNRAAHQNRSRPKNLSFNLPRKTPGDIVGLPAR